VQTEETQTEKRININRIWGPLAFIITNSFLFIYLFTIGNKLLSPEFDYSSGQATFDSPLSLQILIPLILLFSIVLFLIGIKYKIHIIIKLLPFFIFAAAYSNNYITDYLGIDIWQEHKLLGVIFIAGCYAIPIFVLVHFLTKIKIKWLKRQTVIKNSLRMPLLFILTNAILFLHLFFLGREQLASIKIYNSGIVQFMEGFLTGLGILLIPLFGIILFVIGIWYKIHPSIKLLPFFIFALVDSNSEIALVSNLYPWQEDKLLVIIFFFCCVAVLIFTIIHFLPQKWQE